MNNSTNFKNSKRARNRVQCGSMGINQAAAHLPLRVHLALLRRPWRPWGSLADPIRGHLLGWPSTSSRLLELCVCELREAREQARKEGLCVSERKGKLRVKTKQRKGQSTLVLGSEREREREKGACSVQRQKGQKERREQMSNGCQLFFLLFSRVRTALAAHSHCHRNACPHTHPHTSLQFISHLHFLFFPQLPSLTASGPRHMLGLRTTCQSPRVFC